MVSVIASNSTAVNSTGASARTAAGSSAVRDLLAQAARPGMISLAGGLPDAELFPTDELAELTRELIATDGRQLLQYGKTEGADESRQALAKHFDLGDPGRVLITSGSQQGLDLLVQALADPGEQIVVSDPEYLGMLQVLRSRGVEPVPVPTDADGLDIDSLTARLREGLRPKACYLVPHFHNPSGASISADRRAELHRLSTKYGFVVIDDDPYRDLYRPGGRTPGGSAGIDAACDPDWTVRLRTASKSLAPGLRVAVIEAPPRLLDAMVIAKQSADLHTSSLTQAVVAKAVQAPWFPEHLNGLRQSYDRKCTVLFDALQNRFGSRISVTRPQGGMFLWARFEQMDAARSTGSAEPMDCGQWLDRALQAGVCFVPGSAFAVAADLSDYARFSFATASAGQLEEAVDRLANSIDPA
ncbi:MAG: PLP-dependent aminotransferase family protein [Acidimicrobiales bacterium]